jgi:hypothetical protein
MLASFLWNFDCGEGNEVRPILLGFYHNFMALNKLVTIWMKRDNKSFMRQNEFYGDKFVYVKVLEIGT